MAEMKEMYWGNNGRFQKLADELQKKIPVEGEIENPVENPKLERFRQAVNCYYDLYNNGLCNRAQEFRALFRFSGSFHGRNVGCKLKGLAQEQHEFFERRVETFMDNCILEAACEQNLTPVDY